MGYMIARKRFRVRGKRYLDSKQWNCVFCKRGRDVERKSKPIFERIKGIVSNELPKR